jgi:periplasmic protein TonB
MLAYAAGRPLVGKRQPSPHAMLTVVAVHVALIAGVMSARMDLPRIVPHRPLTIDFLPKPTPPPPNTRVKTPPPRPIRIASDQTQANLPLSHIDRVAVDPGPALATGPIEGGGTAVIPSLPITPLAVPARHDAKLLTPASELKPPYPPSKIFSEEEATLRLRLTISVSGRVTAVDPIGVADREFLDAARRYLIAHWRYQPATEDGRAIASSTVITLRFQLDG